MNSTKKQTQQKPVRTYRSAFTISLILNFIMIAVLLSTLVGDSKPAAAPAQGVKVQLTAPTEQPTDAPTNTPPAPSTETLVPPPTLTPVKVIDPFNWDLLQDFPTADANIEKSEGSPVTTCVNKRSSGDQIAKVEIPAPESWLYIKPDFAFGACISPEPVGLTTVKLAEVTDLTVYPWIVAFVPGQGNIPASVPYPSLIQSYVHGNKLQIVAAGEIGTHTVICMQTMKGKQAHYDLVPLEKGETFEYSADSWNGQVYTEVAEADLHAVELGCIAQIAKGLKRPAASVFYVSIEPFKGLWYKPGAP